MAKVNTRPTNGVSYGNKHTVTSTDASDGYVLFDFRFPVTSGTYPTYRYDLVANAQVTNTSGVITNPADLAITYPAYGQVRVGGTLVSGTLINLVAQRAF
jgi:hypothetical protein